MKTFRSLEDVEAADLSPPVHGVVRRMVQHPIDAYAEYGQTHDPEDDGCVMAVEGNDDPEVVAEIRARLASGCIRWTTVGARITRETAA